MLPLTVLRVLARILPAQFPGRLLHRRALALSAAGAPAEADRCFEAAAVCYRRELAVEALARLRVHQLMVRARDGAGPEADPALMIEVVRRLNRLDQLESLTAPHELVDARVVLADWIESGEPVRSPAPVLRVLPAIAQPA